MKKLLIILFMFLALGVFWSCDDGGDSSSVYSFHVYSTGDNFNGIYNLDGGSDITFTDEDDTPEDGFYIYNKDLSGNPTSIRLTIVGETTDTTYIRAEIYKNNIIVNSDEDTRTEIGDGVSFTLEYNFIDDSEEIEE